MSSDIRVKGNVEPANLAICSQVVKSLPLHRFEWLDPIAQTTADKHAIGWVAQEVKAILPQAVCISDAWGFGDFHALNSDQIQKMMYGALQKALVDIDSLQNQVAVLQTLANVPAQANVDQVASVQLGLDLANLYTRGGS